MDALLITSINEIDLVRKPLPYMILMYNIKAYVIDGARTESPADKIPRGQNPRDLVS